MRHKMHFLRDRYRDDSSGCESGVVDEFPTHHAAIEGVGEILLYNVSDLGNPVPEWVRGEVDEEIFDPNLIAVHRAGHWCVARLRGFLRNLSRDPAVTRILDVAVSVSDGFAVFGRDREDRVRQRDAVYQLAQTAFPVDFNTLVLSREPETPGGALGGNAI